MNKNERENKPIMLNIPIDINGISDILKCFDCITILFWDFDEFRDAIELKSWKNNSVDILRVRNKFNFS